MRIRFHLLTVLQHRDRTVTDEVIQATQRALHDSIRLVPRCPLFQHRFEDFRQEKRLLKVFVLQMKQQIPVMFAIGGQGAIECQRDHLLGL